jgi:DNA mismatch repair protein MutL
MKKSEPTGPRIKVLPDHVARKIAAGEVIDRPFSVVRELLDNSLDAGASDITLSLENGGISSIRVIDDGTGMTSEDLKLCILPHATSKIEEEDDIYKIRTLGFRGEALASIATCSRLEITSSVGGALSGYKIEVHGGNVISIGECRSKKGTIVDVSDLFYNMPARKKFLKTSSGEQTMCRSVLIDKSLPFPDVSFRYFSGNQMKLYLAPGSILDRVKAAFSDALPSDELSCEESVEDDFSIKAVLCRPESVRKDRKLIQIFINKRRVTEYSLVQAVEYGFRGFIPGKDFPVAFVFIDVDPALVDFNIHPAKKECRIRNLSRIHQNLTSLVKSFASGFSIAIGSEKKFEAVYTENRFDFPAEPNDAQGHTRSLVYEDNSVKDAVLSEPGTGYSVTPLSETEKATKPIRYFGQLFGLFLLAELGDTFYIVDQHAAHEKILFEQIRKQKPVIQELLFPIVFEATADEKKLLEKNKPLFEKMGIVCSQVERNTYEIGMLPSYLVSAEPEEVIGMLKSSTGSLQEAEDKICALAACRSAIKEGEKIDPVTALDLIDKTFDLENARCPHGRPVWHTITKDELYKLLGRK